MDRYELCTIFSTCWLSESYKENFDKPKMICLLWSSQLGQICPLSEEDLWDIHIQSIFQLLNEDQMAVDKINLLFVTLSLDFSCLTISYLMIPMKPTCDENKR